MIWSKCLVNIFVAVVELATICELFHRFDTKRSVKKVCWSVVAFGYIVFSVGSTFYDSIPPLMILCNCLIFLVLSFTYEIKLKNVIFSLTIFVISGVGYEMLSALLVASINGVTVKAMQDNFILYFIVSLISKFLQYTTVKFLIIFVKPLTTSVGGKYKIAQLIVPIATFVVLLAQSYSVYNTTSMVEKILVVVSSAVLIVANIAFFIIYDFLNKLEYKNFQQQAKVVTLEEQQKSCETLIARQVQSFKTMHDLKHALFAIDSCFESDPAKAKKLIGQLTSTILASQIVQYTSVQSVDILLSTKINEAKEKGIVFNTKFVLNQQIKIDDLDVCVVLGNLIDNAIEACQCVSQKEINLYFSAATHMITIKIDNPTVASSVDVGKSSKEDNLAHGYGLASVKGIAETHGGNIEFCISDGRFVAVVMMLQ
ncbi:MAG: GHKL domain-containing protein [Clostridia bacterium]